MDLLQTITDTQMDRSTLLPHEKQLWECMDTQWTAQLHEVMYLGCKILYLKCIQKQLKGGKISRMVLQKRASQGKETFMWNTYTYQLRPCFKRLKQLY